MKSGEYSRKIEVNGFPTSLRLYIENKVDMGNVMKVLAFVVTKCVETQDDLVELRDIFASDRDWRMDSVKLLEEEEENDGH